MSNLKLLPENMRGRDFVVGDLHGCYDLLMAELGKVDFDKTKDRLLSVGDLVDRGPDSHKCLSLVFEPWFHAVRGNHEEMMEEGLSNRRFDLWILNGGSWVFDEADSLDELKVAAKAAMERMPYAMEVACNGVRFGIVHAEVPGNDWDNVWADDTAELTWGRTRIKRLDQTPVSGIDLVICGHTIVPNPIQYGNVLYIDTGAFNTGRLTLIDLSYLAEQVRAEA